MLTLRTFSIKRLTIPDDAESGSYKREFQLTGDQISGHLGTANAEFTAIVDGEFGKTFVLQSDEWGADVEIGDKLTDGESLKVYDVKGVLRQEDGPGRSVQVILTLPIEQ